MAMTSPDTHSTEQTRSDMRLEQRTRELWQEAARRIDPVTAGRLRATRRHAMETAHGKASRNVRWLIPAGAFAAAALATLMVWQPLTQRRAAPAQVVVHAVESGADLDNELPPDADKTDPNLYQNLDFYGWLAASDNRPANR
jgi:hypothetical protein